MALPTVVEFLRGKNITVEEDNPNARIDEEVADLLIKEFESDKNQKNKSQNPQKVGRCTSNAGIVVLDKTAGETVSIVPKNAAHAILRCQDE